MHLFVVTCGTSLSKSSRCWNGCESFAGCTDLDDYDGEQLVLRAADLAGNPLAHLHGIRQRILLNVEGDERTMDERAEAEVATHFRADCWLSGPRYLLSAELATLRAMNARITDGSRVVLVSGRSNAPDAALIGAILRHLVRIERFPRAEILRRSPVAWDPIDSVTFTRALRALWECTLLELATAPDVQDVSLVLTGGYKAVLIDIGIKIGANPSSAVSSKLRGAYYLHEEKQNALVSIAVTRDPVGAISGTEGTVERFDN